MKTQQAAIMEWAEPRGERYAIEEIKQPTLVVNGNDDIMVPTITRSCFRGTFRAPTYFVSGLWTRRAVSSIPNSSWRTRGLLLDA